MIYEDAWDLWPYCYLNEHGEPEGYNVDLVRMLCEEAGIPCIIRLKPTQQAVQDLRDGQSDLMLGLDNRKEEAGLHCGATVVSLFTHSVVHVNGQENYVRTINDLSRQHIVVHEGSFCHHLMQKKGWGSNAQAEDDMKAAIMRVSTEGRGQIVWNTMSLKWLMHKFNTDNLVMTPVNMPHGQYRFMSADTSLLDRLDSAYKSLSMNGSRMEKMQNKWFYPEQQESGIPSWVWLVTGGIGLLALILLLLNMFYRYRERKMSTIIMQDTNRLSHILRRNNMHIWTYEVGTRTFTWTDTRQQTERKMTPQEFSNYCSRADFERLRNHLRQVALKECEQCTFEIKGATPFGDNDEEREFSIVLSVLRRDKKHDGMPSVVLGTMSDVTEERQQQRKAKETLSRYRSIFDNAMVDMVLYDQEGYIVRLNKRAQNTFGMDNATARKLRANLSDVIDEPGFDLNTFTHYHVTSTLDVYNKFLPNSQASPTGSIKYELQLVPVRDSMNKLLGIYGTGIEVTDFVNLWRQQKSDIARLKAANEEVSTYIKNIDYVMKVGGVRITTYSPHTHMVTIFRETHVVQTQLTQSRCMMLLADKSKKLAMKILDSMDQRTTQPIECEVLTNLKSGGLPMYLQVFFVPVFDHDGQVESYFGMCRDVTDMKTTEEKLAKETARAREVEELKNSFLRNMSYEIRTPLNAVVGFAELFESEHQASDEVVFVNQIKNNASYLLQLINDILFLSRLDAHMIEISQQPVDFAKTFEGHCANGWSAKRKDSVHFSVFNHFNQLVVNIDDTNLGHIIEQVAANAAQYTTSGQVSARYDYFEGKLMIAIEDTGHGISEEQLNHVFERFNTSGSGGTGLGLSICRELAQQMGGHIDITSRVGYGTTVWIVIPCQLLNMERKLETVITV